MSIRARLAELYARLPPVRCQGKCQEACGPIACSAAEAALMERRSGRPLQFNAQTCQCSYLNTDGRCEVYRDRPFVCRAFGASDRLPCVWGCVPDAPPLTRDAEAQLFIQVLEIGGGSVMAQPLGEGA